MSQAVDNEGHQVAWPPPFPYERRSPVCA